MDAVLFKSTPAVFAVGNTYQIMVPVHQDMLMWIRVGNETFYDHANGTLRSATAIHRITVPQALLDQEQAYTICWRIVTERKAYFSQTEAEREWLIPFQPVAGHHARAYLIADAHNDVVATVHAAQWFETHYGELDFLILAGDIPDSSSSIAHFDTIYQIIAELTKGQKPVVYAKGNHDLRGIYADRMDEFTPIQNGHTYFSFRIGDIWGLCLDCGEDKSDDHPEYGYTVCCHAFRREETAYIRNIIAHADEEYLAAGIKHRIIVVHNPFSQVYKPPFDIEHDTYREWCTLLREHIKPDLMISGHLHRLEVNDPGCERDHLGQPCRIVVGTKPFNDVDGNRHFVGTGFIFSDSDTIFVFNDDTGTTYTLV